MYMSWVHMYVSWIQIGHMMLLKSKAVSIYTLCMPYVVVNVPITPRTQSVVTMIQGAKVKLVSHNPQFCHYIVIHHGTSICAYMTFFTVVMSVSRDYRGTEASKTTKPGTMCTG